MIHKSVQFQTQWCVQSFSRNDSGKSSADLSRPNHETSRLTSARFRRIVRHTPEHGPQARCSKEADDFPSQENKECVAHEKLLLTIGLAAITITDTHAQGTVSWRNSVATPILLSILGNTPRIATEADGLSFGLFFGSAGSSADALVQAPGTANIGAVDGILVNASSVLPLPGTEGGQVVSIQVRAWDSVGQMLIGPPVRQVVLGPAPGPGAVIWTTDPASRTFYIVPEPSTLALGALGGLLLLSRCRRSARK
jgi:hypothetical protein